MAVFSVQCWGEWIGRATGRRDRCLEIGQPNSQIAIKIRCLIPERTPGISQKERTSTQHADQPRRFILVGLAALAAGAVNAAGWRRHINHVPHPGCCGHPPIAASITNTVALSPGLFWRHPGPVQGLRGQRRRLWLLIPARAIGGIIGGILLLHSSGAFIYGAGAFPDPCWLPDCWLSRNRFAPGWCVGLREREWSACLRIVGSAASRAGGSLRRLFGAGLSVIVLAVLGLTLDDTLTRLNGLKQAIAFSVNIAAAIFFLFSGQVVWPARLRWRSEALVGGALGGRLAGVTVNL